MPRIINKFANNYHLAPVDEFQTLPAKNSGGELEAQPCTAYMAAAPEQSTPIHRRIFNDFTATPQTQRGATFVQSADELSKVLEEATHFSKQQELVCVTPKCGHLLNHMEITPKSQRTLRACFQQHHIIPKSVWESDLYKHKLNASGIKKDDPQNIMHLPSVRSIPSEISRYGTPLSGRTAEEKGRISALHSGAHDKNYILYIENRLHKIFHSNATRKSKKKQLQKFLSATRGKLLDGSLLLNSVEVNGISHVKYGPNQNFEYIDKYFQVHHLIPIEIFNDTKSDAYKLLKMSNLANDPHFLKNLSSLPIAPYLPDDLRKEKTPMLGRNTAGRAAHHGSHPEYTKMIREKLCKAYKKYFSTKPVSKDAKKRARQAVLALLRNTRARLYSGKLQLS